jgi:DNA polymerase-3 subunit gamma/tau
MSEQTLVIYRKYRPQSFSELIGQEHVIQTLRNSIVLGKIAHAYLFTGPRGCGKTSIARIFSKSANCTGRGDSPEPCNKCQNCVEFNSGKSLDLIEIDAASNRGIDEIKNLRENVRFGPSSGKYKVYLIDEAHMLTKEAFNAFLKTLEEPPAHAVFILATTEANRLPATIISRTQRFDFKRLSVSSLASRLKMICDSEKVKVDAEALVLIANESDGSSRDAEGMLGQILATGEKSISLETAEEMLGLFSHKKVSDLVSLAISGNRAEALHWLQKNIEAGSDVGQLLKSLNHYLRKLVMVGMSPELASGVKAQISEKDFQMLQSQSGKKSPAELAMWLKTFSEAKKNLDHYPLPQMAVEIALINLIDDGKNQISPLRPPFAQSYGVAQQGFEGQANLKSQMFPNKSEIRSMNLETPIIIGHSDTTGQANSKPELQVTSYKLQDSDVLENIKANWNKIVDETRPHNHSLSGFLQAMKPKSATDATLTISTKYGFHKERMSDAKNKKIIEDVIQNVIGKRLSLTCELEK